MTVTKNVRSTKRVKRVKPIKEGKRAYHRRMIASMRQKEPFYNFVANMHGVISDEDSEEYKTWLRTHRIVVPRSTFSPVMRVKCDLGHECTRIRNAYACYDCRFIRIEL